MQWHLWLWHFGWKSKHLAFYGADHRTRYSSRRRLCKRPLALALIRSSRSISSSPLQYVTPASLRRQILFRSTSLADPFYNVSLCISPLLSFSSNVFLSSCFHFGCLFVFSCCLTVYFHVNLWGSGDICCRDRVLTAKGRPNPRYISVFIEANILRVYV